ncbi:hypothetical protein [Agromyces bauzanensis]
MDTDLFVHFAEIAGIFVGFGALIALRSARPTDLHDVVYLKAVLVIGVWVVIAALVPITISRYGVDDHALWLSSAVASLTLWVTSLVLIWRTADFRAINEHLEPVDRSFPVVGLPLHLTIAGSLALIIIGVWPRIDEALYVTGLSAGVVFGGYTLLVSVLSWKLASRSGPERDGR